jgi:hypothetical protein
MCYHLTGAQAMASVLKRSQSVELFLVLAAAAALAECGPEQHVRRCVDGRDTVVDNQNCEGVPQSAAYHWYYGGPSGYVAVGSHVSGGSASSGGAAGEAGESGTAHGVIGGAGEAHGGGGGEGGGE